MAPAHLRLQALVKGRVQGVGFRAFVLQHAANLGLTGWVRNTSIGDVQVLAEGPRDSLEKLIEVLESGPRSAHVIEVEREWLTSSGEYDRFEVSRTV